MKLLVLLLRISLGAFLLVFLIRLAWLFFSALREAIGFGDFVAYDPTVFVLVGLFLLPPTLFALRSLWNYIRRKREEE